MINIKFILYYQSYNQQQKMERVPEIHLFNSGQSWKSHEPYKKFTYTSSSNQFTYTHSSNNSNARSNVSIKQNNTHPRSNSVNSHKDIRVRPGQNNYYENAVRICENNLYGLRNYQNPVSDVGLKRCSYLTYGQKRHPHGNGQSTMNIVNQVINDMPQFKHTADIDVYRKNAQSKKQIQKNQISQQTSFKNIIVDNQSFADNNHSINPIKHVTQSSFLQNSRSADNLTKINFNHQKYQQKLVSFKQITNVISSNLPGGDNTSINNEELNNLDTLRSNDQKQPIKTPRTIMQSKIKQIQSKLPNMLLELTTDLAMNEKVTKQTQYMLEDLSKLKQDNLQTQKEFIRKIDDIIINFGSMKQRDLALSKSTGSLHKRKKLFVTQAAQEK